MIKSFTEQGKKEITYKVAIINFGDRIDCHTRYTDAKNLQNLSPFSASGMTPLGTALRMAKAMVDDKDETKGRWYKPAVILVSDGYPTDSYEEPMRAFINEGRSAKCQCISMGIGNDSDYKMLESFASDSTFCFKAESAADIVNTFKLITMSVTSRSASQKPNDFPGVNAADDMPKSCRSQVNSDDEDDDVLY